MSKPFVKFEMANFLDRGLQEYIRPQPCTMLLQWQEATGMEFWPAITAVPKTDILKDYARSQMWVAMDAVTELLLHDYIRDHELSRGCAVGIA